MCIPYGVRTILNHKEESNTYAVYLQLLSRVNETNLIYLNTFLLLQSLLDSQYFVFWFKIETLLSSRQGLDENLCCRTRGKGLRTTTRARKVVCILVCLYKRNRE
jgi:hypothetical protein